MRRAAREATLIATVIVLALVVWFVIADVENREIESRLGFSLEVEVEDLASNLAVAGFPLPVSVTVIGREADVESARPDDFKATVSLRNRPAGRHSLPVRVTTLEGDVRVGAVQPETAVVILQETVERVVPVVFEPSNLPPLGFRVGAAAVEPEVAVVSGIASEVEAVESVAARLDLGGAAATVERDVRLEARTASGGAVSQVVINPRFARVHVPIEQELFRRTASVLPDVAGAPAAGYQVSSVRAEPAMVDVLVSVEVLDDEALVGTEPLDVSGRTDSFTVRVPLTYAENVTPIGVLQTFARVDVTIEQIISTVALPLEIEFVGERSGLRVDGEPASVEVTLRGPILLFQELGAPLEPIRVDLSAYDAGTHEVALEWTAPQLEGLEQVGLSPAEITVTLVESAQQSVGQ